MDRVIIEQTEGVIRIQVNYTQEKFVKILGAILIGLWAAITVPVFSYDMADSPELVPYELPMVMIFIVSTAGGLLAWWCYSNHQQMISVTLQDGILEIVRAFKFVRLARSFRLGNLFDLMMDAKRTEKPGDKYFLQMQIAVGKWVKISRPSIRIPKDDVEKIYDALRPHINLPSPVQRLGFFRHIAAVESDTDVTVTFRTRLHFITVRYYGILITLLAFFAAMTVLNIFILIAVPELFLYPGLMMEAFPLIFLPFLLPWRKKHLTFNRNVVTLQIHKDRPTIAIQSFVERVPKYYSSVALKSLKSVPLRTARELTFARHSTTEYTAYYTISLNVGTPEEIFLYTTENDAEAEHVKAFLEGLITRA